MGDIGDEPLRLYTVYAPVHHASGKGHATAADAAHDEESNSGQALSWSVQPPQQQSDERV